MKTNAFAAILEMAGVPAVGTLMNVIIFMALISAFSANIYASSRMAYSLSARDMGPRWLLGASASNKARTRSVVEARVTSRPGGPRSARSASSSCWRCWPSWATGTCLVRS